MQILPQTSDVEVFGHGFSIASGLYYYIDISYFKTMTAEFGDYGARHCEEACRNTCLLKGLRYQLAVRSIDALGDLGEPGVDVDKILAEADIIHGVAEAFRGICRDMHNPTPRDTDSSVN